MVIDGSTQPGFAGRPLIVVDGSQILPETYTSNSGLLFYSANNQVRNISFQGFNWNGLTLRFRDATNNTVAGCWIGLGPTGNRAAWNRFQGILIYEGASRNVIGGTNSEARNIISGNLEYGIWISDSNTFGNQVLGNFIGTDATGTTAVPNGGGGIGLFYDAANQIIGGPDVTTRNVISGNISAGVWLSGAAVSNNMVQGNWIGLDATGTAALPNTFSGINVLSGAHHNSVLDNVISGNATEGLRLAGAGTRANVIQGNFIGPDPTGMSFIPNGFLGLAIYEEASGNLIGGSNALARNVISGNKFEGLRLAGVGVSGNVIQGNFIGPAASGTNSLGNGAVGLTLTGGAASNLIGGSVSGSGNIISGNGLYGIYVADPITTGNVIQGNYVGLDADGSTHTPSYTGIYLGGTSNNLIGGLIAGARNVISGNLGAGIQVNRSARNTIQGNFIGTDPSGNLARPNGTDGINLADDSGGNLIGGDVAGAGNVISGNFLHGIRLHSSGTTGTRIQGNLIGTRADGVGPLGNGRDGIWIDAVSTNIVGLALDGSGAPNTIAFNGLSGVRIASDSGPSRGNTVRGNRIHSNGRLGIDLGAELVNSDGVTANDPGDADTGPNELQNYPVITNAFASGFTTIIAGRLDGAPQRSFLIDVYRNPASDPSGFGEGQFPVGGAVVATDGSGRADFSLMLEGNFAGQVFSATATSMATGDTSEFGTSRLATNSPAPPAFGHLNGLTETGFTATISVTLGQPYRVQATTNLGAVPLVWTTVTSFTAAASSFPFLDPAATNLSARFYRVISP